MDDLTAKVQEILGSEEGMKQLQDMARMLGLSPGGDGTEAPPSPPPAPSPAQPPASGGPDLGALLSGLMGGSQPQAPALPPSPPSATAGGDGGFHLNPADLLKIRQLMQTVHQDTPDTLLLKALRPLVRAERQRRVDEAIRLIRLLALLPILQQSGLLKGLFDGIF